MQKIAEIAPLSWLNPLDGGGNVYISIYKMTEDDVQYWSLNVQFA